ncbi:MAG TPA: hypothetical protein VFI73_06365 [Candidatus Nitrosopolaris sp.]|nr:hypothetical protein [Candidatus Nitrosopolaris sp.]
MCAERPDLTSKYLRHQLIGKHRLLSTNIISHMLSNKGIVISNELEFPFSNLPWLNKHKDNVKFVKVKKVIRYK